MAAEMQNCLCCPTPVILGTGGQSCQPVLCHMGVLCVCGAAGLVTAVTAPASAENTTRCLVVFLLLYASAWSVVHLPDMPGVAVQWLVI